MRTILVLLLLAAPARLFAAAIGDRTPDVRQLQYAEGLRRLGLYREAAREYGIFVKQYPSHKYAGMAAYLRAHSYYKYSSRSAYRKAARQAVAQFHRDFPNHPMKNLGYFLLGEISMEEALDLEEDIGRLKKADEPTAAKQRQFEDACKRAVSDYADFIRQTDLSKYPANSSALDEMTGRVVTAYYNIAQCKRGLGDFATAIDVYRKLVTQPEFADYGRDEAQFMVGRTYFDWAKKQASGKAERLRTAREEYKRVMFFGFGEGGRSEFSDDARLGEAWCLFELGSTNDCRKLLRDNEAFFGQIYDQFKDNPNHVDPRWVRSLWPEIYYLYGKCLFKDEQFEEAKGFFERVMKMGGYNPWKAEATRMLDECLAAIAKGADRRIATEQDAQKTYELAYNKYVTGQREDAAADFERIWHEFKGIHTWKYRDYVLYYWGKSLFASGEDGRLFEAAAVFNHLAKVGLPGNIVTTEDGQRVSVVTEALYWEGHSNWRLAEGMEEGGEKDAFIEAAILAFEKLAYIQPYHPKTAETLLNVGNHHLRKKDYVRAGLAYHKMVTLFPDHPDRPAALVNLCYVYRELDQLDDVIWAATEFEKTYPKEPDVVRIIDLKGNAYFKRAKAAEDPEQEKAYYAKAAAEYSKLRPEAFSWLSDLQREGEYGKIFANALFYAGFSYEKIGDTDKALDSYRAFVAMAPPSNTFYAEGFARCAQTYYQLGKYDEAVAVARPYVDALNAPEEKGEQVIAALVPSLLKLAGAEQDEAKAKELGNEARADARKLFEVYKSTPVHHDSFLTIADAFRQAGRFDDMLETYEALVANQRLRLDRADATPAENRLAFSTYTQVLFEAGSAIADVADEVASKGGSSKRFDVEAGKFLSAHLEQASQILGRGVIPKNFVDVQFRVAGIFRRAGDTEGAAGALNRVITVAPPDDANFLKAYYERGNTWREGGNPERAIASYIYVVEWADPNNPAIDRYTALSLYQLGISLYAIEKKDEAKAQFERLIKRYGKEAKDTVIQDAVAKARDRLKDLAAETAGGAGGN